MKMKMRINDYLKEHPPGVVFPLGSLAVLRHPVWLVVALVAIWTTSAAWARGAANAAKENQ